MTGCATPQKGLLERTSSYVLYDLPTGTVMQAAAEVLGERGYTLLPSTDPRLLHTPWKVDGNFDMGSRWSRLYIESRPRPDGRVRVRAYELYASTYGRTQLLPAMPADQAYAPDEQSHTTPTVLIASEPSLPIHSSRPVMRRNLELEWAILERLNPQFAGRVKEQVDRYVAQGGH
ncbi:hypothetical protein LZ198_04610 [Myxococcus sp. K15C18031901]|uniref:hypothetical protein n=1 Tax=Myxococcus dinghuensis TaxID=2906761 RepID=UPI0020A7B4F2|nr:hypothetical protein [Myxococcus dinghuensis]MCP3098158.1 hypothetical protein [Myxococcus dinghuensis]